MDDIIKKVIENNKKLNACKKHDFSVDTTPTLTLGKKWQCVHCEGTISSTDKMWYEKGLNHGKEVQ